MSKYNLKKVSGTLILMYLLIPLLIGAIAGLAIMGFVIKDHIRQILTFMLIIGGFIYIFEFILITDIVFSANKKKFKRVCQDHGCNINNFYDGDTAYILIDPQAGKMGLLFKFNPFHPYIISLNDVTDVKSSNGASALCLGGTREVYFTFIIEGVKVKIRTLRAERTLALRHPDVITALTTADEMVDKILRRERIVL